MNRNHYENNSPRYFKRLKTTLGPKMVLLIFRLRLAAREPVWKLHTAFSRRYVKCQIKLQRNGPRKKKPFCFQTFLKERILLMGVKLTRRVFQLVEPTNAEPT